MIQRFLGHTDGIAFHEPVVIVYVRELNELEERERTLDLIAEDALWHDGHDNPEALEDIRKTVKSLGYTQTAVKEEAS